VDAMQQHCCLNAHTAVRRTDLLTLNGLQTMQLTCLHEASFAKIMP